MRHRGEIKHERGGPESVNRGLFGLGARRQHCFLKIGDGKLTISLTEGYQSNPGGHQIGNITLQEGGQGQSSWNTLPRRTNSNDDGQGRRNVAFAEYFRKPVQHVIGPHLA